MFASSYTFIKKCDILHSCSTDPSNKGYLHTENIYINLSTEFTYAESIYVNTLCVQDMHTQIPICIAKWS